MNITRNYPLIAATTPNAAEGSHVLSSGTQRLHASCPALAAFRLFRGLPTVTVLQKLPPQPAEPKANIDHDVFDDNTEEKPQRPRQGCWRDLKMSHLWAAKMAHSANGERAARRSSRGWPWGGRQAESRVKRGSPARGEAMHEVSKQVRFRALLEGGMSKTAISRELVIGRRTATRWAAAERAGRCGAALTYGPRPAAPSVLDPYKEIVRVRLSAYPELSAVRLFRELRESGYPGGYDVVKRYVREVRPRPVKEPVVRFETEPGRQVQVDFAHFRLPLGTR